MLYLIDKEMQNLQLTNEIEKIKTEQLHYDILAHQNRQLMAYAHDAKNHLLTIRDLNDNPEIEEYIGEMLNSLGSYSNIADSGNTTLDVILNRYKIQCDLQNVDFIFDIRADNLQFMSSYDLVTVLSNSMDNAMEAVANCDEKYIRLTTTARSNHTLLTISNTCSTPPEMKQGMPQTTKKDKKAHGLGLKNVRKTVRKYAGDISFEYDGEQKLFTAKIILGVKKKRT